VEAFGLGELQLMPEQLWRLTPHEFWLKYRAFMRAEGRLQAVALDYALLTQRFKKQDRLKLTKAVYDLRQYPEKRWFKSDQ
jgi:hypothetical protein